LVYDLGGNTPWCNGNTRDFGSLVLGSSPSGVVFLEGACGSVSVT
jgi:hypothetical protein